MATSAGGEVVGPGCVNGREVEKQVDELMKAVDESFHSRLGIWITIPDARLKISFSIFRVAGRW